jgi:hypothetical protein
MMKWSGRSWHQLTFTLGVKGIDVMREKVHLENLTRIGGVVLSEEISLADYRHYFNE